jgi:hypothetical protein
MIWANLIHLSFNMWCDRECNEWGLEHVVGKPYMRFDQDLWVELKSRMRDAGMNMVVIDLGDGVKYNSHPELAVSGAWEVDQLKEELVKLREMGLEPIPKLNFSSTHDLWMGPYSRCLSTPVYYEVCSDLIKEVCSIFDKPRFFHLGMDEETWEHQQFYEYVVVRQYDLWWHDFLKLVDSVEAAGSKAWIWSDYIWHHPELFAERMPKSVLQSNWYYGDEFNEGINYVKAYNDLDTQGFDQIPTGSNWSFPTCFERTVEYCSKTIAQDKLKGFLQTIWRPTLPVCREVHLAAIDQVEKARKTLEK